MPTEMVGMLFISVALSRERIPEVTNVSFQMKRWHVTALIIPVVAALLASPIWHELFGGDSSKAPIKVTVQNTIQLGTTGVSNSLPTDVQPLSGKWRSLMVSCRYAINIAVKEKEISVYGPNNKESRQYKIVKQQGAKVVVDADGQRGEFRLVDGKLHLQTGNDVEEFEKCDD